MPTGFSDFPFGYRNDQGRPDVLLVHANEANVIRSVCARVAACDPVGDAAGKVASDLNEAGIPAPPVNGMTPSEGWSSAVVNTVVSDLRHVGILVVDSAAADDNDATAEGKSLASRATPPYVFSPDQAVVARPLFLAANRLLRSGAAETLDKILEALRTDLETGLHPPAPSTAVVPSTVATATTMPPLADDMGAPDTTSVFNDSGAPLAGQLPVRPSTRSAQMVQRVPFDHARPKPTILGADALPSASRRPLAPSSQTRSRLRPIAWFYARYSTEPQEQKSEERQFTDIAIYAKKTSFDEGKRFSDRGLSGTGMANRKGLQSMMMQARLERPSAIIVEDLDRLSRKLPDLLALFYELKLLGIEVHDITLGKLDLIHIVMRGYMAEEGRVRFLATNRAGKNQALRDGKLISKGAYGYRLDPEMKGVHLIDADAQTIVQWIFRSVADGMSVGACARHLTRNKVYPPAQWRKLAAGGDVAAIKPWQPTSILKIIHNHIYLGFVTFNRSVRVLDPGSGKTTAYHMADEKEWIVAKYPDLAIIDEETWTRAALRLADQVYRGETSILRFLLTRKAKCSCGAFLKARAAEGATYFECSSRMLASGCDVRDHHRLDWVERAVLDEVLKAAHGPNGLTRHAQVFEAEIAKILAKDVSRAREIKRRLAKIDDLQMASFDSRTMEGFKEKRVVAMRAAREEEAEELESELGRLRSPASFLGVLHTMKSIKSDLSRMLEEVPFRPTDPEGIAMANAVRDAIGEVVVHPADADGWTRIVIVIDYLEQFRAASGVADLGRVELETGFKAADLRAAERAANSDRNGVAMAEAAADGRYDLTDAEWALLKPLTRQIDLKKGGKIAARALVEGMVCLGRAGGPRHRVPSRYGDADVFNRAAKRFVYAGQWDIAKRLLAELGSIWIKEPGLARFDTMDYPRRTAGRRPEGSAAARDRAELLELAAKEPEGDPVRLRCELVVMILDGEPIADAARALGVGLSSAYHHWDRYKAHGVDALRRKYHHITQEYLTKAQIKELSKIAKAGIDPDNRDELITYPILCRVCFDRFGKQYSRGGMNLLARRYGFLLQPFVAAARRRQNLANGLPVLPPLTPRRISPLHARQGTTSSSKKARRADKQDRGAA